MITLAELNPHNYPTNKFIDANLNILLERINELLEMYGKPVKVTSGLRSDEQQMDLVASGKSTAKVSKHCSGNACDLYDPDKELAKWCLANLKTLEKVGLWIENPDYCANWVHFQSMAPMSGKRVFIP